MFNKRFLKQIFFWKTYLFHYLLKCSHTTAYASVWPYARIRRYTLEVRYAYVVYGPHTLAYVGVRCYTRRLK